MSAIRPESARLWIQHARQIPHTCQKQKNISVYIIRVLEGGGAAAPESAPLELQQITILLNIKPSLTLKTRNKKTYTKPQTGSLVTPHSNRAILAK